MLEQIEQSLAADVQKRAEEAGIVEKKFKYIEELKRRYEKPYPKD